MQLTLKPAVALPMTALAAVAADQLAACREEVLTNASFRLEGTLAAWCELFAQQIGGLTS